MFRIPLNAPISHHVFHHSVILQYLNIEVRGDTEPVPTKPMHILIVSTFPI